MRRYILILVLALVCVFLVVPAAAEDIPFMGGFTESDVALRDLNRKLGEILDPFSGHWEFQGDTRYVVKDDLTGAPDTLVCTGPSGSSAGYMSFQYLDPVELGNISSLSFGILISDTLSTPVDTELDPDGVLPFGLYRVNVTVTLGETDYSSEVYVHGNSWVLIHTDLPKSAGQEVMTSLKIRLEYNDTMPPAEVRLTPPGKTDRSLNRVLRFSTDSITAVSGSLYVTDEQIRVIPDMEHTAVLEAEVMMPGYTSGGFRYYLAVTLDNTAAGGSLSAAGLYAGEQTYRESKALPVKQGENTYFFPLPIPEYTGDITTGGSYASQPFLLEGYRLLFHGVDPLNNGMSGPCSVRSVQVLVGDGRDWNGSGLGNITESTLRNQTLIYAGTLTRDTVIDYINEELSLMAVPVWDRYSLENAVKLDVVRVSNNFVFELPAASVENYSKYWLFFAAITRKDGTVLPINRPEMLSGTTPAPCTVSALGLHDASVVGVYESNVSHVIVDVPLDTLVLPEGTPGVTVSYMDGKSYTLSSSVLDALDSEILFYTNAGMEVYLRLVSVSAGGKNFTMPALETPADYTSYSAVISYLSRRYPEIAAYTLGYGVNVAAMNTDTTNLPSYCASLASWAAITYRAAAYYIPDIYVILPFCDNHTYRGYSVTDSFPIDQLTVLFADNLASYGDIPYAISFSFEDDRILETAVTLPGTLSSLLYRYQLPEFFDFLCVWEPERCLDEEKMPFNLTERYHILCENLKDENPRAVILSLTHISDNISQEMYAGIKQMGAENLQSHIGRRIYDCTATFGTGTAMETLTGNVTALWDFSDAYTTHGFLAGGGIRTLETAYSPLLSGLQKNTGVSDDSTPNKVYSRVLRCEMPVHITDTENTAGDAGGVLLRNLSGKVEMSEVDKLVFTFSLEQTGPNPAPATVIFLVGADDWRAEYRLENVTPGKIHYAICDLNTYDYNGPIGNIGVMLHAKDSLTFDLASVEAVSETLTAEEMQSMFLLQEEEIPAQTYVTEAVYIFMILLALTVCMMILLTRRDKEEENHGT